MVVLARIRSAGCADVIHAPLLRGLEPRIDSFVAGLVLIDDIVGDGGRDFAAAADRAAEARANRTRTPWPEDPSHFEWKMAIEDAVDAERRLKKDWEVLQEVVEARRRGGGT